MKQLWAKTVKDSKFISKIWRRLDFLAETTFDHIDQIEKLKSI